MIRSLSLGECSEIRALVQAQGALEADHVPAVQVRRFGGECVFSLLAWPRSSFGSQQTRLSFITTADCASQKKKSQKVNSGSIKSDRTHDAVGRLEKK